MAFVVGRDTITSFPSALKKPLHRGK